MELSHLDQEGNLRMVDITEKSMTHREARAMARVRMKRETMDLLLKKALPKGDVFTVAKIAGITGAKKTSDLIPLCHPINLSDIEIEFEVLNDTDEIIIRSLVKVDAKTGVEMEALTAVTLSALTIYDMCKAVDKEIVITDIMLLEKSGGRSGRFVRSNR